jgi:hypothetical protein
MICPQQRIGRIGGLVVLGALALMSGCQSAQPASPIGQIVAIGDGTVSFLRWPDGPAVMICCDVQAGTSSQGDRISGPPWVRKVEGSVASKDGRQVNWEVETTDGRSVKCRVDGKEYDPAKGTLFLVRTKGGKTEVEQLSRDLSAVQPVAESCQKFAENDPAVSKLLGKGSD